MATSHKTWEHKKPTGSAKAHKENISELKQFLQIGTIPVYCQPHKNAQ